MNLKNGNQLDKAFRKEYLKLLKDEINAPVHKKHRKKKSHKSSKKKKWKNPDDLQSITKNIIKFAKDYKRAQERKIKRTLGGFISANQKKSNCPKWKNWQKNTAKEAFSDCLEWESARMAESKPPTSLST